MQAGYCSSFVRACGFNVFTAEHVPLHARGTALIISPFLEERLFCRPVLRSLSDALMDAGWHCMRFDTPGEGDSDGDLSEVGLEESLLQIEYLAEVLRKKAQGPLLLIGLRWGASLALAASRRVGADAVIAVEPMVKGEDYLQQLLRQNLTTQMATWGGVRQDRAALLEESEAGESVNVQGFDLGPRLVSELRRFEVPAPDQERHTLLVRCAAHDAPPPPAWQALLQRDGARYRSVPVRPFWFEPRQYDPVQLPLQQVILDRLKEWFR